MINHLRSLLLNVNGSNSPGTSFPGEQYVPPEFISRPVTSELQQVRDLLFGVGPDRAILNYRLQELLTCIHTSPFADYVTAIDPRITYWPFNSSIFQKILAGPVVTALSGTSPLYFLNVNQAASVGNRIYFSWLLTIVNNATLKIDQYSDNARYGNTTYIAFTTTNGLSSPVLISDNGLSVCFNPVVGSQWRIDFLVKPSTSLRQVVADLDGGISNDTQNALFPSGCPEPYATFGALWNQSDQIPLRIAGLTLALGYRMDNLPGE